MFHLHKRIIVSTIVCGNKIDMIYHNRAICVLDSKLSQIHTLDLKMEEFAYTTCKTNHNAPLNSGLKKLKPRVWYFFS